MKGQEILQWRRGLWPLLVAGGLSVGLVTGATPARAQNDDTTFQVGEETRPSEAPLDEPAAAAPAQAANSGPVRLARFSFVRGNVTWRMDDSAEWSTGSLNLPLRQGAQVWVTQGGRGEIQFDDGSVLRLGSGALVTLQTLYSDADGEFTEIRVNDGLVSLSLRHEHSIYQVDTPLVSLKANGPGQVRLGVGDGVEVAVRSGRATVEGERGKVTLEEGSYLDLRDAQSEFVTHGLPHADNWDRWNEERDSALFDNGQRDSKRYLPSNVAIVAGDLDDYGTWRDDEEYGHVWCPRVSESGWRPYHDGHWTWVSSFGWTWVSSEPWGWAPYHYGTWISRPYGWGWVPGPVNQYWSPAVVQFSECDGQVAWVPLAPREVCYPSSLGLAFRSREWSLFFSIGSAGVYYPDSHNRFYGRPYNNITINNITNVYNGRGSNSPAFNRFSLSAENAFINHNGYARSGYIPYNARVAAGASAASFGAFGSRGDYVGLPRASTSLFANGQAIASPLNGRGPIGGPPAVRPTSLAFSPNRTVLHDVGLPHDALTRPVFRAPLSPLMARQSTPLRSGGNIGNASSRGGWPAGERGGLPTVSQRPTPSQGSGLPGSAVGTRGGFPSSRGDVSASRGGLPTTGSGFPTASTGLPSVRRTPAIGGFPGNTTRERGGFPTGNSSRFPAASAGEAAARARQSMGLPGSSGTSSWPERRERTPGYTQRTRPDASTSPFGSGERTRPDTSGSPFGGGRERSSGGFPVNRERSTSGFPSSTGRSSGGFPTHTERSSSGGFPGSVRSERNSPVIRETPRFTPAPESRRAPDMPRTSNPPPRSSGGGGLPGRSEAPRREPAPDRSRDDRKKDGGGGLPGRH